MKKGKKAPQGAGILSGTLGVLIGVPLGLALAAFIFWLYFMLIATGNVVGLIILTCVMFALNKGRT